MKRHALIPAPSYEVLSSDWHAVIPGGPDPVLHVQQETIEPIDFRQVDIGPRESDFNTRPSRLQSIFDLWWPGQSTWQEVHAPLFRTALDQPLALMPQGTQLALGLRSNIRSPSPFGQGDLSDAAQELYPTEE